MSYTGYGLPSNILTPSKDFRVEKDRLVETVQWAVDAGLPDDHLASWTSADAFSKARRIVVKIGSALLVDADSGKANRDVLTAIAADVARIRAGGRQVLIVSSGSIALGRRALGLRKSASLPEKQAAAAVGQSLLMRAWEEALSPHAVTCAQILLTPDDTEVRSRWLNARATLETLLALKAVPVINENDTVATDEIRFGDNDRLAARVAQMIGADGLVLVSAGAVHNEVMRRDRAALAELYERVDVLP